MRGLYIALGVLLVLWLISLIRVGGIAEYSAEGVLVRLRAGPFKVELFPGKPAGEKKSKPSKEQKKKKKPVRPKEPVPLTEKVGGALELFQELLPVALDAVGKLFGKLRVDELVFHLTWAAADPASAAIGYGAGQAVLGAIWPLLDNALDIRRRDVGVAVDFRSTAPVIYARASLSFTVGQLLTLGAVSGFKALRAFLRARRARKRGHRGPATGKRPEDTAAGAALPPEKQTNIATNGKEGSLL